jgi:hypothetical protein
MRDPARMLAGYLIALVASGLFWLAIVLIVR